MERFRVITLNRDTFGVLDRARRKVAPYTSLNLAEYAARHWTKMTDDELERDYNWTDCPPEHAFTCAIYRAHEANKCGAL